MDSYIKVQEVIAPRLFSGFELESGNHFKLELGIQYHRKFHFMQ